MFVIDLNALRLIGPIDRPQNIDNLLEDGFDTIPVKRGKGKGENSHRLMQLDMSSDS